MSEEDVVEGVIWFPIWLVVVALDSPPDPMWTAAAEVIDVNIDVIIGGCLLAAPVGLGEDSLREEGDWMVWVVVLLGEGRPLPNKEGPFRTASTPAPASRTVCKKVTDGPKSIAQRWVGEKTIFCFKFLTTFTFYFLKCAN